MKTYRRATPISAAVLPWKVIDITVGTHSVGSDIKGRWGKGAPERMSKQVRQEVSSVRCKRRECPWAERREEAPMWAPLPSAPDTAEGRAWALREAGGGKAVQRLTFSSWRENEQKLQPWVKSSSSLLETTLVLTSLVFQWLISDSFDGKLLSQLLTTCYLQWFVCLEAEVVVRKGMWLCHSESSRRCSPVCLRCQVLLRIKRY